MLVVGQQSNRLKKQSKKSEVRYVWVLTSRYCSFSPQTKNVSLTFIGRTEHLQDAVLTKLLGQFIELDNAQFFQRTENLRQYFSPFSHNILKNYRLMSPLKAFTWKILGTRNVDCSGLNKSAWAKYT